jgi:hypothetical protein
VSTARIADWLSLAAAPAFAVMGLLSALTGNADPICSSSAASPFDSMAAMYLAMSAFHLPTWLRRAARTKPPLQC